jgi:hypothetical protein
MIITRGAASAKGFGFAGGDGKAPPGTYTFPLNYVGYNYYFPVGWPLVNISVYGSGGASYYQSDGGGYGSKATKNNVSASSIYIYGPTSRTASSWYGGGYGGAGGSASVTPYTGGNGGAVCAATFSGGSGLVLAAGGGGKSPTGTPSARGGIEGTNYQDAQGSGPSGTCGGSGYSGGCYSGGGGGGGGYSTGGNGGARRNGGNAGGNGGTPSSSGPGSYGYDTLVVASNAGQGYAELSWG